MKKPIDIYLIVENRSGKPIRDKLYYTEKNALEGIKWHGDRYSLYKYSTVAVRINDEWVDVEQVQ